MPRHKQIATCRKSGGPLSKHCGCEHCALDVCSVCGGAEGSLTTDCPGTKVDSDRHQEICETNLDYTDDLGWHLSAKRRAPRFEHTVVPPDPPRADPRAIVTPSIDWIAVDRHASLQHELGKKAIAWVMADRTCEDHSAALARVEDEIDDRLAAGDAPPDLGHELAKLESAKISFRLADQRAQRCNDEFRQAARVLVAALEDAPGAAGVMLFTRTCGCTVVAGAACPHFIAAGAGSNGSDPQAP
jgi:hypothetical protein